MQHKLNIYQIFLTVLTIVTFSSCDKSDDLNVNSADFNVSSKTVYLGETITLEAKDTLGNASYTWYFGDGTSSKDGYRISHQYIESGNFTASLKINGLNQSRTIRVLPGKFSYQIENHSDTRLDILTYISNYEDGSVKRMDVDELTKTDTIYATCRVRFSDQNLLGISIFVENSEYTLAEVLFLKEFQHRIITINDSTKLLPRSSNGIPSVILLKDLYKSN